MKKVLLVLGILSIVACVIFVLFALLYMYGYHNLLDGTAEHYRHLHQKMICSYVAGAVFAVIGAVCFIIRAKI